MLDIAYATNKDIPVWLGYDNQISESELLLKIAAKRCYILKNNADPVGIMRYNLLYDTIPFLTLIYFDETARGRGYGTQAVLYWEDEMRCLGFACVMTSSQSDEKAQFFYRKLGYRDTGCLILDSPSLAQPAEIFFIKEL